MSVTHSRSAVGMNPDGEAAWNAEHTIDLDANAQTGTTYTLKASDNGKTVTLNNASAITLTIPASLGAGFSCLLVQLGAGTVTVAAGAGATVNSRGSLLDLNGQYAVASVIPTATADTYILAGDLA